MTKAKRANDCCLPAHWKVRICIQGAAVLHFISSTEPSVVVGAGGLTRVDMEPICGTEHGDTLGYIYWPDVSAVTWRYAPLAKEG